MISISGFVRTAAPVALAFLSVVPAFAQGGASLLTGTVKDVNGGVLPGVTLKVTDVATNASVDAVTDSEGVYRAAALATGTYRVEAALDGFESPALAFDHTRQRVEGTTQVGGRGTDAACREPPVGGHRGRPQLHAAELQRLRSRHRHRHAAALVSGRGRHVAEPGLEDRTRPPDLDDGVALLGLEAVERPRLHRPAGDDDLVRHLQAEPVDAGSALRG